MSVFVQHRGTTPEEMCNVTVISKDTTMDYAEIKVNGESLEAGSYALAVGTKVECIVSSNVASENCRVYVDGTEVLRTAGSYIYEISKDCEFTLNSHIVIVEHTYKRWGEITITTT